ncbi:MAG: Cof-type HAD-IIB family hydrolase [Anaerolineales bacterium]|nr:Cof-type HAD-IIB family hydrolase [Anaerolineales bacterium]
MGFNQQFSRCGLETMSEEQRTRLRNIKAVGIDVDFTLLGSDFMVSEKNRQAIIAAQKAGLGVHLITGRSLQTLQPILEEVPFTDLMAISGGAFIYDPVQQSIVDRRLISRRAAEIVVETARAANAAIFLYYPEEIYMEATPELLEGWHGSRTYHPVKTKDILAETSGDPNKIAVFGENAQLRSVEAKARISGAELFYAYPHSYFLDVTHLEAGKGDALLRLCSKVGIRPEEMLVIGDGENDLPMFAKAGFGVALENAAEALKITADCIGPSNENHGVAWVLEMLLAVGR